MYKNIALFVLLLPFSGYTINKNARIKEIEKTIDRLNAQQELVLMNFLCRFPLNVLSDSQEELDSFKAIVRKYMEQIESLDKEYSDLKQSLDK